MSRADELAQQFYRWERWGRGRMVAGYPVDIEPPFAPFIEHETHKPTVDDGRRPTFLSGLADRFFRIGNSKKPPDSRIQNPTLPVRFAAEVSLVELQIALPPQLHVRAESFDLFLESISYCEHWLSFEIIGLKDSITIQLVAAESDADGILRQLKSHFPELVANRLSGLLSKSWGECAAAERTILECSYAHEFMIPMRSRLNFGNDALVAVVGAISELRKNEVAVLQVLFKPARHRWLESIMRSVTDDDGTAFFANAPELVAQATKKISRPLYAVVLRLAAKCESQGRLLSILREMVATLTQFSEPNSNELIPLKNDGYSSSAHEDDLLKRHSHRCGMLMNVDELCSIVHFPAPAVRQEKLVRSTKKTKAAPDLALNHSLILGENVHAGEMRMVTLAPAQRVRHMSVTGASGTGKSTFLLNMILQDIERGDGLAVLDPHGDLIDKILCRIPESRINDVIVFDPADEEWPVGFNILTAHSAVEKNLLSSDLVSVFQRLSTSWGDQMTSVLGNAVLAFLESRRGGTLSDLRRFLIEPAFRAEFLESVDDSEVVYYWKKEFPLLSGRPHASILTRLDAFLRPKLIRHVIAQKENRLDFAAIMNSKKIFLAKLAHGLVGVENSYLLGSFLVSKFHQIIMGRQDVSESSRQDFWMYIDEFHHFITPSMAALLSGARKYRLGLILAHQDLQQIESRDRDVASAVLANAYTRVCFRLGDADARKLADGFSAFDARDLQSLGTGEAICRIERSAFDFNLTIPSVNYSEDEDSEVRRGQIIDASRAHYASRREEVEASLRQNVSDDSNSPLVTKATPISDSRQAAPRALKEPGKGGAQHTLVQSLIKKCGSECGFRVTVEKAVVGGGSIDVALERDGVSIACEINVATNIEHETENLHKCLAAGYTFVLMIAADQSRLDKLRESAESALDAESLKRVRFLNPDEAFAFIQSLEDRSARKTHGYEVEVRSREFVNGSASPRQEEIDEVLDSIIKRWGADRD